VVRAEIRNVKRRGSWQLGGAAVGLARCDGYSPSVPAAHSPRTTANTSTNFSATEPGLRQAERRRAYTHAFGPSHPGHGSVRNDRNGHRSSDGVAQPAVGGPRFVAGERIPDTASRRSGAMRPMHSIRQRVSSPITWSIEPRSYSTSATFQAILAMNSASAAYVDPEVPTPHSPHRSQSCSRDNRRPKCLGTSIPHERSIFPPPRLSGRIGLE
jgi:hypothetical protein